MTYEVDRNDKEIRILEAAQTLFSRYGVRKTSIEEIAKSAGLGKGTVYLYFKSKDEIFDAVAQKFGQILTDKLQTEIADAPTHSRKLEQYIMVRLRFIHDLIQTNGLTAEVMNEASCTPAMHRVREKFGAQQIALLKQIIDDGVAAGEFETSDSEISAIAIFVAMNGLEKPWTFQGRQLPLDDLVKALIDLYLVGLKKRK
ncbi:TetR/AcrR family transcriptional regulator [Oligoflexus tunisiensis]|uniref:TetR/AcrR family transcriptional regulator n=1 Tax=Oligoflexus tunisiensis TaxID=708132 RepID=UPI000AEE3D1C|nr:TetR/AcrR family transcriptional regulator [Oligoflexus tunisiensis]